MRSFTEAELANYDGTGENPAYAAYNGKVYDVSSGPSWIMGTHHEHVAGENLTEAMEDAPHGDEVRDNYPVVGELVS